MFQNYQQQKKNNLEKEGYYRAPFKTKKEMIKYFKIKNPATGKRYIIPMLSKLDPDYVYKYASMMWTKEHQPDLFNAIMKWD